MLGAPPELWLEYVLVCDGACETTRCWPGCCFWRGAGGKGCCGERAVGEAMLDAGELRAVENSGDVGGGRPAAVRCWMASCT